MIVVRVVRDRRGKNMQVVERRQYKLADPFGEGTDLIEALLGRREGTSTVQ